MTNARTLKCTKLGCTSLRRSRGLCKKHLKLDPRNISAHRPRGMSAPRPKPRSNLSEKAMIAHLRISSWTGNLFDREATEQVAVEAGAQTDAGRYTKHLLTRSALKNVYRCALAARSIHKTLTMPWEDDGARLLPVAMYNRYKVSLDELIEDRADAVIALIARWDELQEEAEARLGRLFKESEFPSKEFLRDRITMSYEFRPVPEAQHFVADLSAEETRQIQSDIEAQVTAQLTSGIASLYRRLQEAVENCKQKISIEGGKKTIFRNSVIENLRGLVAIVPRLNITDDPKLNEMVDQIRRTLTELDHPDQLRVDRREFDPDVHEAVKSSMDDLSDKFSGYFAGNVSIRNKG